MPKKKKKKISLWRVEKKVKMWIYGSDLIQCNNTRDNIFIIKNKNLWDLQRVQQAAVREACATSNWSEVQRAVRQSWNLSQYLFNIYTEYVMRNVKDNKTYENLYPFIIIRNVWFWNLYADDMVVPRHCQGIRTVNL